MKQTILHEYAALRAERYIRAIKNAAKRRYAIAVYERLSHGEETDGIAYDCSYMAAQAVRMELHKIADGSC